MPLVPQVDAAEAFARQHNCRPVPAAKLQLAALRARLRPEVGQVARLQLRAAEHVARPRKERLAQRAVSVEAQQGLLRHRLRRHPAREDIAVRQ
eukprot:6985573-Alexandrium_andersonii.AAC.1